MENNRLPRICFKDTATPEQIKSAMDAVYDAFIEQEAARRGLTVEQLKEVMKLEAEAKIRKEKEVAETKQRREKEAAATQKVYPDFDLDRESNNPETGQRFISLLDSGVDVKTAYEVVHIDSLVNSKRRKTTRSRWFYLSCGVVLIILAIILGSSISNHEKAYNEGKKVGRKVGYEEGYDDGLMAGALNSDESANISIDSWLEGYNAGYQEGIASYEAYDYWHDSIYEEGYSDGYSEADDLADAAYDNGHFDGYLEGYDDSKEGRTPQYGLDKFY